MPGRRTHSDDDNEDAWEADGPYGIDGEDGEDEHAARDRHRFSSETAFCPECGAEIYDAADVCPKCFTWIDGETVRHGRRNAKARFRATVVWLLIAAMLFGTGLFAWRIWW